MTEGRLTVISFCLAMAVFALPISTSGLDIFTALALGLILITPKYRRDIQYYLFRPGCLFAMLFFLYTCIACLWSSASLHDQGIVVEKYAKLLYLPIIASGFSHIKTRIWALYAFFAAMVLTCCLAWFKWLGVVHFAGDDMGYIFRNHIITGYMMNIAAYLALLWSVKSSGKLRVLYGVLFLLFSFPVLFIGTGRMAYLTYFLLMTLFVMQHVAWRRVFAALMLLMFVLMGSYFFSHTMQTGVKSVYSEVVAFQQDTKNTSIGYRLQFHHFAYEVFKRNPWIGQGTGGFSVAFEKENPVPAWGLRLFEPHSQYWLVAADGGMIGLFLLFALFVGLFYECIAIKDKAAMGAALLISFVFACLSDSFLLYSVTNSILILGMGVCLGGRVRESLPTVRVVDLARGVIERFFSNKPRVA